MLTHLGFSAWIVSNNQPLPECLVAVDESANRVSCWIPSEAGKQFSVHWSDEGSNVHTCSFISLDGFVVPGRFLYGAGSTSRDGVRTGSTTERPFIFAKDRGAPSRGKGHRDVGTIVLKIKRVRLDGQKAANPLQTIPDASSSHATVSDHCIGYGDERPTYEQCPSTWKIKPLEESSRRSYVTFIFRYRPHEFLLSQGIIQEDDGASQSAPRTKGVPSQQRRVASAPVVGGETTGILITPSPSPSPRERMSTALKAAFWPDTVRHRAAQSVRTVSMNAPRRHDPYPGEGILQLYPPPDPSRFKKGSDGGPGLQESQAQSVE